MSDWQQLALIFAISISIGLGLRFYLQRKQSAKFEQIQRVGQSMSWPYYAAGTVFFWAFAVASWDRIPFFALFSAFAVLQLCMAVRQFIRERSRYGVRHLLGAMTVAAILFALGRWFGMAVTVLLGVAAGVASLLLFGLEWVKQKTTSADSVNGP